MPLDLDALRTLRAVARAGSISAAARALGVGQSTVSVVVAQLEEALETPLFHRGARGVTMTAAGELLLGRAEQLLAQVDDLVAELRELRDEEAGSFVIGCHDALGGYFLPQFLPAFFAAHPRVSLTLWNRSSAEVRDAVLAREVHFGLVVNTVPHDDLVLWHGWVDRIEVFGPPGSDASDLLRGALVYPNREPFLGLLQQLEVKGLAPARRVPCGDLGLTRRLASALGFALLPRRVALDAPGLAPVAGDLPRHDDVIHVVYRADLPKTRAARLLRDALLASAAAL
jgi:molybdate transport repressor ModE-like protein